MRPPRGLCAGHQRDRSAAQATRRRHRRAYDPILALAAVAALVVAVAATLPGGAAGAAPPDAGRLEPGRSLGGITLGASRADVVAAWGHAFGRCRNCPVETLYFNRSAFRPEGAGVSLEHGRVVAVFTLWAPPGWRTADGLRIGEHVLRLHATYRPLRRTACGGYEAFALPDSGPRSVVYVVDDRIWGFALLAGGQAICR